MMKEVHVYRAHQKEVNCTFLYLETEFHVLRFISLDALFFLISLEVS